MTLKREKIVLTALVGLAATGTLLVQQEATVAASPYTSGLESATSTNQKQIVVNLVDDAGNPVTWFQADGTNGGSSIEYAGQDGNLEGMQLIALPAGVTATGVTSSDQGQIAMVQGGQLYVTLSAIQGSVAHFTLTGAAFASSNPASSAATDPGSVASSASSVAPSASSVQVSHSASGASSVVTTPTAVPSSVVTSSASSSAAVLPSDTTSEVASETPVVPNVPAQSSITVAPSQSVASSASETSDSATVTPSSVTSSAASAPASMAAVAASDTVVQSEATPVAPQSNGATQVILPALATQPAAIVNLPKMATTITPTKQIDWQAPTSASAVIDAAAALQQPAQATPVSATSPASAKSSAQPSAKRDQPNDTTVVKKGSLLSSTADAPKPSMWNDKARTFSALSVGMSALAVAAQMLLSKLTIFKNLLQ
ncbi:hypothetical protein [Weissella cibaria]|uniref:Uncharacterized protein n=1 Tax=Weissella cibaria TaxID=137591 RepID=A0A2S1KTD2_9LACO|nr:hypothetical protein [Weissella cibaria]AWF96224.1 hypothetical protein B6254_1861 [Weissella cibaria]